MPDFTAKSWSNLGTKAGVSPHPGGSLAFFNRLNHKATLLSGCAFCRSHLHDCREGTADHVLDTTDLETEGSVEGECL